MNILKWFWNPFLPIEKQNYDNFSELMMDLTHFYFYQLKNNYMESITKIVNYKFRAKFDTKNGIDKICYLPLEWEKSAPMLYFAMQCQNATSLEMLSYRK